MNKVIIKNLINLESVSFLLFFMVIVAYPSNRMASVINISSLGLIVICFIFFIKNYKENFERLKLFCKKRKVFFLLNIWCLFSIFIFTYSNFASTALIAFIKDWRYIIGVLLFLIIFNKEKQKIKNTVNIAVIVSLCITIFIWPFLIKSINDDRPFHIIMRNQLGGYMTVFYPFILSTFFYYKSIIIKGLMFFLIIATFFFLFYTGLRGGLLSVLIESIIVLYYFSSNIKTFVIYLLSYMILFAGLVFISYYSIPQFQQKVNQTLENNNVSSSRDLIITSRFPIIVNSTQHLLTGIGYDSVSYNTYLLEQNAPKVVGYYDKQQEYIYNNDEPFFLTMLYNVGLIGLILFIGTFFINLKDIYKGLKEKKDIFNVSFMAFGIGYFLIFCSFELVSMRLFFLFSVLSVLCITNNNKISMDK